MNFESIVKMLESITPGNEKGLRVRSLFIAAPPSFVKGRGGWIFELNEIWGELKFFKINGGKKKRGETGIFEIFIGGKLLEIKLQTENKISD